MLFITRVIDIVTRRHQPIANAAVRLIEGCEAEFNFDSGVRRVLVLSGPREGRYLPRERLLFAATVRIAPMPLRAPALREFVFHEMGHAIVEHHEVGDYLGPFTQRTIDDDAYEEESNAAAERTRPAGFVSGYATCDREEDFCETLAAYLTNRSTWRTRLSFNGEQIAVRNNARLRRKLDAVHELLGELHTFTPVG